MINKKTILILGLTTVCLSACSEAREQLGLEKNAPDEFAVIKRAPLSMPPDYKLRPPQPGAPRPQEQAPNEQARQTVFGSSAGQTTTSSGSGENLLIHQAGGEQADPNIRQKVDEETSSLHDRNKPVAEKLLGIGGDKDEPSATVVDAPKEAERLQKNIEEGKPLTEGETPSIEE